MTLIKLKYGIRNLSTNLNRKFEPLEFYLRISHTFSVVLVADILNCFVVNFI